MRKGRLVGAAVAIGLGVALSAGAVDAKKDLKPKAGAYVGKVTNANGKGTVRLIYATFNVGPHNKPTKGPQLFAWKGILKCEDGSTQEAGPTVFAALSGAKFSGGSKTATQTVTLTGKFTSTTKLEGTARLITDAGSPHTRCATGAVTFTAQRVNN